ncbi:MAG: TrmH family RNA methyltransferase [Actinomycetota bacterium]
MVSSVRNPRVQEARKLRRRAARDEAGTFLAEGPKPVAAALAAGARVHDLFIGESARPDPGLLESARARKVAVTRVGDAVIRAICDAATPQGVVAVVAMGPQPELPARPTLVVVLAEVRDPGNAGTLVRSAVAAGADAVVFSKGSADPFGPKTVRAAAGALFAVPVLRDVDLPSVFGALRARGVTIVGTDARATTTYDALDLTRPVAFALGNEAWGLDPSTVALTDETVRVPMPGDAESLNVGIAGSLLLFEAVRQRRGLSSSPS